MNKIRIYFILLALTAVACNKDELITTDVEQVPIITFDTDPAVYPVKVGREFTITPSYQSVDRPFTHGNWKKRAKSSRPNRSSPTGSTPAMKFRKASTATTSTWR